MKINNLFKNFVLSKNLNLDNDKLKNLSYQIENNSEHRNMSNVGGYQSTDISDHSELQELKDLINLHGDEIRKSYRLSNEVQMTRLWLNINRHKDYNKQHTHRDSLFSGVYYINLPKDTGIVFVHPSPNYGFSWGNAKFDTDCFSDGYYYEPKNGELLIFPSWLVHYVPSNFTHEDRLSLSFDLV